jgi:hypothetical protein
MEVHRQGYPSSFGIGLNYYSWKNNSVAIRTTYKPRNLKLATELLELHD